MRRLPLEMLLEGYTKNEETPTGDDGRIYQE